LSSPVIRLGITAAERAIWSCRLRLWGDGEASMGVTGIGGFFFRAQNPEALRAWYAEHLGVGSEPYGA